MRHFPWLVTGALVLSLLVPGQVRAGEAGAGRAGRAPEPVPVPAAPAAVAPVPIVDPAQVYTYEQLTKDLMALAERYPELVRLRSIGQSAYDREIWALGLGTGPAVVLLNGAHHGSEWLTVNLLAAMADDYALAGARDEAIGGLLADATLWFVPMVNPDGVTLSQVGPAAFLPEARERLRQLNGGSDDFRGRKANGQGVDLNRQYPADWEHIVASPAAPAFSHYKGAAPLSAPESRALYQFTLEVDPEIVVAYHSAGRVIYWHFHTAPENADRDLAIAERLAELTGYDLMPVEENPSGGGYKDWFVQTVGRPGFTIEIGQYIDGGPLPLSAFAEEWERNRDVGLVLAAEAVRLRSMR
ncbi:MAG TPA: M14 family metallocarboxypeptidase [Symbiobacteriaceae bacterium]|nr:M14 family metallocarboxypeptidase [Symbiobacteriaceae bacterium]